MKTHAAWDLIGFPDCSDPCGNDAEKRLCDEYEFVRIVGGRALYDSVSYEDASGGRNVRLSRLDAGDDGLHAVVRYVDPDTKLELIRSDTSAPA